MTQQTYGDVPLLDPDTGRFPNQFAPPSVAEDVEAAQQARADALDAQAAAEGAAGAAAGSATTAEQIVETGQHLAYPLVDVTGDIDLSDIDRNAILAWRFVGNVTVTALPADPIPGQIITLDVRQDGVGSRTLTIKGVLTAYATAIAPSTSANARDLIHVIATGSGWVATLSAPSLGTPAGWAV